MKNKSQTDDMEIKNESDLNEDDQSRNPTRDRDQSGNLGGEASRGEIDNSDDMGDMGGEMSDTDFDDSDLF